MTSTLPLRAAFATLGRLAPDLAARWALELFFTPRGPRRSRRAAAFLEAGRLFEVRVDGRRVAAWSWGQGPVGLLVHGWAGIGGQLAAFGRPLLSRGYRVVTFDAPGHGQSDGRRSSIVHFAKAIRAVSDAAGEPRAIVAHSLGAAATTRALSEGLAPERVVFVGPTGGPRDWARRFAKELSVPEKVMARMRQRSEAWLQASWEEFDIPRLAARQTAQLLVIHDRDDAEVPWRDGAAIAAAWPGARLLTTEGLGHRRILRDADVVERAVGFLRGEAVSGERWQPACATPECTGRAGPGGLCEACALEGSLYRPELRRPAV